MLYVLIDGPAEIEEVEIKESIRALLDQPVPEGEVAWFMIPHLGDLSPTMKAVMKSIDEHELFYAVVTGEETKLPKALSTGNDDAVYRLRRVPQGLFTTIEAEIEDGSDEQVIGIVLLGEEGEVKEGSDLDFILTEICKREWPLLDMGGQMTPIEFNDDEAPDVNQQEADEKFDEIASNLKAEGVGQGDDDERDPLEVKREELMEVSIVDLRKMVKKAGVEPTDTRSKKGLVDALLRDEERARAAETSEDDDDPEEAPAAPAVQSSRRQPTNWAASPDQAAHANDAKPGLAAMAVSLAIVDGMLQITVDPKTISQDLLVLVRQNGAVSFK